MAKISENIGNTIENWSQRWGNRLKDWVANVLSFGFDVFFKVLGKSFAPKLKPIIDELERSTDLPDYLKPILKEIAEPTGEVGAILAQSAGGAIVGGAIGSVIDALFLRFAYDVNSFFHPRIANEGQLLAYWLRNPNWTDELDKNLRKLGADDSTIAILKELSHVRLDPATVGRL